MKLRSFRIHQVVGGIFLVALVLAGTNYMFDLGYLGQNARAIAAVILLLFLIYAAFFAPTRREMGEYLTVKRSMKDKRPDTQ